MLLGALTQAGADLRAISDLLAPLIPEGFTIEPEEVEIRGLAATRIHVLTGPQDVIRTYAHIRAVLEDAELPDEPKATAQRIYRLLAEAAARTGRKEVELVTFHEWGDLDCLVEVVGTALAFDMLEVDRVFSSTVPTGLGMVRTEHGMMPVPSPIVMELLQGIPTYSRGVSAELISPTGAAILAAVDRGDHQAVSAAVQQGARERQPPSHVLERVEPDHPHVADRHLRQLPELALPQGQLAHGPLEPLDGLRLLPGQQPQALVRGKLAARSPPLAERGAQADHHRQCRQRQRDDGDDRERGVRESQHRDVWGKVAGSEPKYTSRSAGRR